MIYFLVTATLFANCPIRDEQYKNGIRALKESIRSLEIENYCIVLIENNGIRDTFLIHEDGCEVYYSYNNVFLSTGNKGYKELQDLLDCIEGFQIQDTDFIVKMTGRYVLHKHSEFMNAVKQLQDTQYECILRYGSYSNPVHHKTNDCITGLIGMSCRHIKRIQIPKEHECVEWLWAEVANSIAEDKVCIVSQLGIDICPAGNEYFSV